MGENVVETFENILRVDVKWPKNMSAQCRNLLESIFVRDPNLRITAEDIKDHIFFAGVDWSDLNDSFAQERDQIC